MRPIRFLPLLLLPLLAACVDDRTAYTPAEGNDAITLIREQPLFWEKKVNLSLVVARMPDCMRRHELLKDSEPTTTVELFEYEPTTYIVRIGQQMWVTETRTCEGFAPMDKPAPKGMGTLLGTWTPSAEGMAFVPAPGAKKPADR